MATEENAFQNDKIGNGSKQAAVIKEAVQCDAPPSKTQTDNLRET